jgi:2,3-bisphosphoglycerate-dependent phosphoglycerate mutase
MGAMEGVTTLFWVRHGEADNNRDQRFGGWSALPLTDRGRRQADAAAKHIATLSPTAIISSDVARAHQTAEAIARTTGLAIAAEPGLRERSLGVFDGLAFAEAQSAHPELYARMIARDPTALPEGAEAATVVHDRVADAIERAVAAHPGGRVVVVSHGIALYHAFNHVCGLAPGGGGGRVFTLVDNASLSWLEHRDGPRWRIVAWNRVDHLAGVD